MTHERGEPSLKIPALTVWEWRCFEDISKKNHSVNQWINNKSVYRTAPATLGLLIRLTMVSRMLYSRGEDLLPSHCTAGASPSSLSVIVSCQGKARGPWLAAVSQNKNCSYSHSLKHWLQRAVEGVQCVQLCTIFSVHEGHQCIECIVYSVQCV